jgi:hypothetical protein
LKNLKSLLLHANPIRTLPVSLHEIWKSLQEFSIDWLAYLLPYLGRIIKNMPDGPSHDEKRSISASRIRVFDATKSAVGGGMKQKMSQRDKACYAMQKFGSMLSDFSLDNLTIFHFHHFLCFHMRRYPG